MLGGSSASGRKTKAANPDLNAISFGQSYHLRRSPLVYNGRCTRINFQAFFSASQWFDTFPLSFEANHRGEAEDRGQSFLKKTCCST